MDLHKGDRVRITVVGTIVTIQTVGCDLLVDVDGHMGRYAFSSDKIESVERISLKIGDPVVPLSGGLVRKILAIHDEYVWCDDGGAKGGPQTYRLDHLRLAI